MTKFPSEEPDGSVPVAYHLVEMNRGQERRRWSNIVEDAALMVVVVLFVAWAVGGAR